MKVFLIKFFIEISQSIVMFVNKHISIINLDRLLSQKAEIEKSNMKSSLISLR